MKRVLSGMQASGRLHIGNLIGALQNWVRLQDEYECFYFVADWHGLTTGYAEPSEIRKSTMDLLINFLASGLDPEKCTIFLQSKVLEHAELHLMLSMITPLGWLERVPTYKEKQEELKDRDLSTYGFLGYPVLQSADILLYKANFVPVGIDQMPHLEIT
ncbi:MAG: tryptophan--tRNA ligase, partial [Nitrospirae bacterium]|nr:tryptophan--tRNA ligase [Nitrospirota bacterium]